MELAGKKVEWNIDDIAEVRTVVVEILCGSLRLMSELELYPYVTLDEPKEKGGILRRISILRLLTRD